MGTDRPLHRARPCSARECVAATARGHGSTAAGGLLGGRGTFFKAARAGCTGPGRGGAVSRLHCTRPRLGREAAL